MPENKSFIYIYISSYMKIEIFDRGEKDLIVFGKMNGGGDGSRYCLRAYVNAMCWSPLKGSQWKIGDFISSSTPHHPSYCVYPILFLISFFPEFESMEVSLDRSSTPFCLPPSFPPPFTPSRPLPKTIHTSQSRYSSRARTIDGINR